MAAFHRLIWHYHQGPPWPGPGASRLFQDLQIGGSLAAGGRGRTQNWRLSYVWHVCAESRSNRLEIATRLHAGLLIHEYVCLIKELNHLRSPTRNKPCLVFSYATLSNTKCWFLQQYEMLSNSEGAKPGWPRQGNGALALVFTFTSELHLTQSAFQVKLMGDSTSVAHSAV